ncbi:MAG: helix-turn-helix domain-containing protein [Rickettsiales bacterium]|nr:helix-turn-helix domain-containing protein [Rickettsiales bacterium]
MKKQKKRNIGEEILASVKGIKAGEGKRTPLYTPDDIRRAREVLAFSQAGFASALHVSPRTLQAWEQGRRRPSGAALALLSIAVARPDVIRQVLSPQ